MNTLLIGPRGCGKSSVGQRLADILVRPFVELDTCVLQTFAQSTVQEIWSVHGEPAWRTAELEQLNRVLAEDGQVVALGGGTPMIEEAQRRIHAERESGRAHVIYLACDPAQLRRRLQDNIADRPALTRAGALDEIEQVLRQREPTYLGLADVIIEAGQHTADQIAADLAKKIP